ncbi:MAG TPA: hypothetical protein VF800_31050 [Telluria sp.]|jgi:hypothetical protein
MFWKLIRWGGTALVLLLVIAAAFISTQHGQTQHDQTQQDQTVTPVQPADAQQQTNKNFNF